MSEVVVTGATGFIGGYLVERLVGRGDKVVCLARDTSDCRHIEALGAKVKRVSLEDGAGLAGAFSGADVVYHVAGMIYEMDRGAHQRVNAGAVSHVARTCAGCDSPPVMVLVSSLAAAGPSLNGKSRTEDDAPSPVSSYGRSKLDGERAVREWAARVPVTIVRPTVVFGARDRQLLPLLKPAARLGVLFAPGSKANRLSFVHVEDLVSMLVLAAEHGERIEQVAVDAPTAAEGCISRRTIAISVMPNSATCGVKRSVGGDFA